MIDQINIIMVFLLPIFFIKKCMHTMMNNVNTFKSTMAYSGRAGFDAINKLQRRSGTWSLYTHSTAVEQGTQSAVTDASPANDFEGPLVVSEIIDLSQDISDDEKEEAHVSKALVNIIDLLHDDSDDNDEEVHVIKAPVISAPVKNGTVDLSQDNSDDKYEEQGTQSTVADRSPANDIGGSLVVNETIDLSKDNSNGSGAMNQVRVDTIVTKEEEEKDMPPLTDLTHVVTSGKFESCKGIKICADEKSIWLCLISDECDHKMDQTQTICLRKSQVQELDSYNFIASINTANVEDEDNVWVKYEEQCWECPKCWHYITNDAGLCTNIVEGVQCWGTKWCDHEKEEAHVQSPATPPVDVEPLDDTIITEKDNKSQSFNNDDNIMRVPNPHPDGSSDAVNEEDPTHEDDISWDEVEEPVWSSSDGSSYAVNEEELTTPAETTSTTTIAAVTPPCLWKQ